MKKETLEVYGFTPDRAEAFTPYGNQGLVCGRVVEERRGLYTVVSAAGEVAAELSGRFRNEGESFPAVGDWVALRATEPALIEAVLERTSKIARNAAGRETQEQVIGANVDTAFLVMAVDKAFNASAAERYLTMLWESGAEPVLLLTKIDACEDPAGTVAAAEASAAGAEVRAVSAVDGTGLDALDRWLVPGRTVCLLGSSGAGKSTLLNTLAGREIAATQAVREADGKGRHTTTARQLHKLPSGALVVDTPGMRELQLWDAGGIRDAFEDVEALARECRFGDCTHEGNAGCAVEGAVGERRLQSWRKLRRELAYHDRKKDDSARREEEKKWKRISVWQKRLRKRDDP
jgi:ribosome biogenesis GTPase